MSTRSIRIAGLTGVAAIGLSLLGVALPAAAADPAGAVTYSGFSTHQSASSMSVDFDYAPVDPAAPGTITVDVVNYTACSTISTNTITVPVTAAGHYSGVIPIPTNNKSYVALYSTDGASLVYRETQYQWDAAAPTQTTASITPDADPATGVLQITAAFDRWGSHYQVEVDGVSTTPFPTTITACSTDTAPYTALAAGSTIAIFSTEVGHVQLATLTNSAAPVTPPVTPPGGGLVPAGSAGSTTPSTLSTLALTGFDGRPLGIVGGLLTAAGIGAWLWARREKRALAGN